MVKRWPRALAARRSGTVIGRRSCTVAVPLPAVALAVLGMTRSFLFPARGASKGFPSLALRASWATSERSRFQTLLNYRRGGCPGKRRPRHRNSRSLRRAQLALVDFVLADLGRDAAPRQ